jgi:hypothetical protein
VLPECGVGVRFLSRAAHGVDGRHSTPERVLQGNFRLPCANLLKRGPLWCEARLHTLESCCNERPTASK